MSDTVTVQEPVEGGRAAGRYRLGIDLGGTFTDACLWDSQTNRLRTLKINTDPAEPVQSVIEAVSRALIDLDACARLAYLGHGTTIATNALLERRGARTAVITTAGFRDVLELARQQRPHLYDLQSEKPAPLVPRESSFELAERVMFDGTIERALDESDVVALAQHLRAHAADAVAVCFLHSYLDSRHERIVKEIISRELPSAFITASHEVVAEFREYERLSTVVINAYLGPGSGRYFAGLGPSLIAAGVTTEPHVTQSNGGVCTLKAAASQPVRTLLSGPSTGVVAAAHIGRLAECDDLITLDMGGTSTDVSLVVGGEPEMKYSTEFDGLPVKTPMLDIESVGAGGGSVAWIDSGLLKVGPRSAGAIPGPACYARGGDEPTVTDAHVVLGTLKTSSLAGGELAIDASRAQEAVARLGSRLGLSLERTAEGIVAVVTANMAAAVRSISINRGHDPREFNLVAFGGAGPLHASRLARELGIPRVLVPGQCGVLSAFGLLLTDLRTDFSVTRLLPATAEHWPLAVEGIRGLEARARDWFETNGISDADRSMRRWIDMRYTGQNYELAVELPEHELDRETAVTELRRLFVARHERAYGHSPSDREMQIVTLRMECAATIPKATLPRDERRRHGGAPEALEERRVYAVDVGDWLNFQVYERASLEYGHKLEGPAIVEHEDSTTVIAPGDSATVDAFGTIVIAVGAAL